MAQKLIRCLVGLSLLGFLISVALFGQTFKSLVGKWNMTSETDNGDPVQWTLILREDDGKPTALLNTDSGEQPAKDFTYTDGVLKFKAPYQGEDYDIELKVTPENNLDGTWSGGGNSGKTTGKKSPVAQ